MNHFEYRRANVMGDALHYGALDGARFLAGGTNLIDLMKERVERPDRLVDIGRLPLDRIEDLDGGGLRLGALATNSATARDTRVTSRYPVLASAILAGASPQLRNAAMNGGNLNQRTRCYYFFDTATQCNKREPGTGCSAIGGLNRIHAILGASEHCIATHPSDMCVALAVLEATVNVTGPGGDRTIEFADYHRLPGDTPARDNTLGTGELVTSIDLPSEGFSAHHTYLKLRDRSSYAFALVSVAAVMSLDPAGRIAEVRLALGGVAHKPWRVPEAESMLIGAEPATEAFAEAADRVLAGARGQGSNDFKIELARRAVVRALSQAAAGRPQSQTDKRVA